MLPGVQQGYEGGREGGIGADFVGSSSSTLVSSMVAPVASSIVAASVITASALAIILLRWSDLSSRRGHSSGGDGCAS